MEELFLDKLYPPSKSSQLRGKISQFKQQDCEPLHKTWEQFENLLRRCLQHGKEKWVLIDIFHNGLHEKQNQFWIILVKIHS